MNNNKLKRAIEYLSELDNVPSEIIHDLMQLEAKKQNPYGYLKSSNSKFYVEVVGAPDIERNSDYSPLSHPPTAKA